MNNELFNILKRINGRLECVIDGVEMCFENGDAAINKLDFTLHIYDIDEIAAKEDIVILRLSEISEKIAEKNKRFIEDYKKMYGVEPSFF